MHEALKLSLTADGLLPTFHAHSDGNYPPSEQLGLASYEIRVMLAHIRNLFDNGRTGAGYEALHECFDTLRSSQQIAVPGGPKRDRRQARLAQRPHPFPFFRDMAAAEQADDPAPGSPADEEESTSAIAHYFDYQALRAVCLRSDGSGCQKSKQKIKSNSKPVLPLLAFKIK